MSSLIVKIRKVAEVKHHPLADRLDVATIEGWDTIVGRDSLKEGDLVTFVPPDAIIPTDLADKLGFRQYLRGANHDRVGLAKIRGVVSYGLVLPCPVDTNVDSRGCVPIVEGEDVATFWGITKFEPPVRPIQGTPREKDLTFPEYIEIENFKNFKDCFQPGEMVQITEKIDGTNCRLGIEITADGIKIKAGSHHVNRQDPGVELWSTYPYWYPHSIVGVQNYLRDCISSEWGKTVGNIITLYGEVFGAVQGGVKSMDYGSRGTLRFRMFGIMENYTWLIPDAVNGVCDEYGIPQVPILYYGAYDPSRLVGIFNQDSIVAATFGKKQIMEGVVIQSLSNPLKILKVLNPEYLLLKYKAEDKGEEFDVQDE